MSQCPNCLSASVVAIDDTGDGIVYECVICGDTWFEEMSDDEYYEMLEEQGIYDDDTEDTQS